MAALFVMLAAVAVSMLINRIATIALRLTGVSREMAEFQARSVITGTGYTTGESENIVRHPVRRRIIKTTMLVQSAGLVTVISTFVISFVGAANTVEVLQRGTILVAGLLVLLYLSQSEWVEHRLETIITRLLLAYGDLEVKDYHMLLNVDKGYVVNRFKIDERSWLANNSLEELELLKEGVIILSIHRGDGSVSCAPRGTYVLRPGDAITAYGRKDHLRELSDRKAGPEGDAAHERAIEEHEHVKREADREEEARENAWLGHGQRTKHGIQ